MTSLLRGAHVLPLAMFFVTFAWPLVYVSLPSWDSAAALPSALRSHGPAVAR